MQPFLLDRKIFFEKVVHALYTSNNNDRFGS